MSEQTSFLWWSCLANKTDFVLVTTGSDFVDLGSPKETVQDFYVLYIRCY